MIIKLLEAAGVGITVVGVSVLLAEIIYRKFFRSEI
jgi:hypothetical protein